MTPNEIKAVTDLLKYAEGLLAELKESGYCDDKLIPWQFANARAVISTTKEKQEIIELEKYKARLDWLLNQGLCWRDCDKENPREHWVVGENTEWLYGRDKYRDEGIKRIDAAIEMAKGK